MRTGLPGAPALMLMVGVISFPVFPSCLPDDKSLMGDPYWIRCFTTRLANLGSTDLGGFIDEFVQRDALVCLLADLCLIDSEINTQTGQILEALIYPFW